jgi:uncharacterized protein YxjI
MTFMKVSLPAGMVLFMLCQAAALAATLKSSDDAFSLNVPGKWQVSESTDPRSALLAKKGKAQIKIQSLSRPATEKALTAKLQATRIKLRKGGVEVPNKILSVTTEEGIKVFFLQFVSKGKEYRSGYFNLADQSYSFLLTGLSDAEFEALSVSLVPLAEEGGTSPAEQEEPAEQTAAPAPAAAELPAPPVNTLPAASTDTLGAPPASDTFAAGGAKPEPADLPPLPKRQVGDMLMLFLAAVAVSAAALGYRAFAGRSREEVPAAPPVPGSLFPFRVERKYFSFPIVFNVKDAAGQQYRAVSHRVPALVLSSGLVLYFLLKALVQFFIFAGVEMNNVPDLVVTAILRLLSLSNFMIFIGALLTISFRKKLKVYDPAGHLFIDVCEKRLSMFSQIFLIRDHAGNALGKMKRVGFVLIRRRWQLLDNEDKVLIDIREDSSGKAIARKFLGHLWGLLRTNYKISDGNSEAGELKRDFSIWNRYTLDLASLQNPAPDPHLVMATSLFIDIVDPDRWHPWHG